MARSGHEAAALRASSTWSAGTSISWPRALDVALVVVVLEQVRGEGVAAPMSPAEIGADGQLHAVTSHVSGRRQQGHHRPASALHQRLLGRQLEVRDDLQPLLDGDLHDHPGQVSAEAAVRAAREAEVVVGLAVTMNSSGWS